jgi:hypothetical protein
MERLIRRGEHKVVVPHDLLVGGRPYLAVPYDVTIRVQVGQGHSRGRVPGRGQRGKQRRMTVAKEAHCPYAGRGEVQQRGVL